VAGSAAPHRFCCAKLGAPQRFASLLKLRILPMRVSLAATADSL